MDANKRVNGRKRQFVVDTRGRLWAADVHAVNNRDGLGGLRVIRDILWGASERLEKVYGDQAYNGVFKEVLEAWCIDFEKASRAESDKGFVPVAKRWPSRRYGCGAEYRLDKLLSSVGKDDEYTLSSSKNWLYLANSQLMLQRMPSELIVYFPARS